MSITGSIIVYVLIWWIIFFSVLPVGIQPNKEKFIYGKAMEISDKEKILMKNFIKEEIKKFPNLPNDLLNLF